MYADFGFDGGTTATIGDTVYRDDDGIVEQREVETGTANWDHTEILDGLDEGELVVTSVEREGLADGVAARREVDDTE